MSFYHILPSDSAKNRFPNNKAAQFSIPIDDSQQLTGLWEVAVAQLTYSNCLYMFDHETISIEEQPTRAYEYDTGCRIPIPSWTNNDRESAFKFIINYLNKSLKNIMSLTPTDNLRYDSVVKKDWVVCFSGLLTYEMGNFSAEERGNFSSAMTSYDNGKGNYQAMSGNLNYVKDQFYVDVVPLNEKTLVKKIVLKAKNSDMIIDTLIKKFNYHLQLNGKKVAKMFTTDGGRIIIDKLNTDDNLVLVCSEGFHKFLNHRTAAVHEQFKLAHHHDYTNQFSREWSVFLYKKNTKPVGAFAVKTKVLQNHIMKSEKDAVRYLNDIVDDSRVHFKLLNNVLSLSVGGKNVVVKVDNTLRDILGFDQNTFESGNVVQAKDVISLTRRINYFQIYSNITKNVRVGDIEAQLLTMIPFNPKDCSVLSERHFKKLHYVDIKSNYIPQIDISIYDDAGALIPFHKDAITTITLHFRRKS